ncbi:MAG: glycosyltransferase [Vicinamibacterales bacterium]
MSIVIPVHGKDDLTDHCLTRLGEVLPPDIDVEVLVVDDASDPPFRLAAAHPRCVQVLRSEVQSGFGATCNLGAQAATGEVLVFLNNDTLPQANWLEPLLGTLAEPRVGAVGAQLVYPDGTLQEAGGRIFRDGTGWNVGKGADAQDPLFQVRRDVDYCSAAALATRRSLFLECGGFDQRYAPAYYEDTDYCFALRERGLRVVYQPLSIVEHVEGGTAGRDESRGVKHFQERNRHRFSEKWATRLESHPPAESLTRAALMRLISSSPSSPRVLFWAPGPPEFDKESGSRRLFDLVVGLAAEGWHVSLIAESATEGQRYISDLRQRGVVVYAGPETCWAGAEYLPDPERVLAEGAFDVVLFQFWWLAERYVPLVRRTSSARVVVDTVDLHCLRHARQQFGPSASVDDLSRLTGRQADEQRREVATYKSTDAVLSVSAAEAEALTRLLGRAGLVHVVPDIEDASHPMPAGSEDRSGMLFLGSFRHPPNIDGLEYLGHELLPLIPASVLKRHSVTVVGTDLTRELAERAGLLREHVRLAGWVPSVEPYLRSAAVFMAPLRFGAGTKRKLIQAALSGTPIVTTSVGVEGLELAHGVSALVADSAEAFVEATCRIVDDQTLARSLATHARRVMASCHGADVAGARLAEVLSAVMRAPR